MGGKVEGQHVGVQLDSEHFPDEFPAGLDPVHASGSAAANTGA